MRELERRYGCLLRLSYTEVAEFQHRGVVHFHAFVRLDGRDPHTTPTRSSSLTAGSSRARCDCRCTISTTPGRSPPPPWPPTWNNEDPAEEETTLLVGSLVLDNARGNVPRPRTRQTVGEYLDYWLEHVVRPESRGTTYAGYETMVRRHIKPALGRKYLDALRPADVRRFVADLRVKRTEGHGGGPRVLSPRMVQFAHAVLRNALSNAMREELVTRNVAKLVKVSTPDYEVGSGLDPVTAKAFLGAIRDERLFALYLCAIVLGMRRGELLGLEWAAVDLDRGRLTVRQTLTVVNGKLSFQRPKTRTSRRVVPLPDVVVDALRARGERQEKERAEAGQAWAGSGLVFTTPDGRLIPPGTLGKQWRGCCQILLSTRAGDDQA